MRSSWPARPPIQTGSARKFGLYGIEPAEAITACEGHWLPIRTIRALFFNLGRAHAARSLLDNQPGQKEQAGQSFKAAADQGYPAAQVALAAFYWLGSGGFQRYTGQAMGL